MRSLTPALLALPLAALLTGCTTSTSCADSGFRCLPDPSTGEPTDTDSASTTDTPTSTTDATATTESLTTTDTTGGPNGDPSSYGEACAPDDGLATEFKIGLEQRECNADFPADAPIFRIVLFTQGPGELAPGEYKLDGGFGFAYLDQGDGSPLTGDVGTLTVVAVTADGLVGTYDVTLQDSTNLVGEFDALYCPVDVLCG